MSVRYVRHLASPIIEGDRVNCVELSCIVYRVRWNLWIEKVDNVTLPHR